MRSKIRKIANYLTFYEILSTLGIFEPIYLTLKNISENEKNYIFKTYSILRTKFNIAFFYKKSKTNYFKSGNPFLFFIFFSVSPNLANIRVKLKKKIG